jgi:hypothetical protein
LFFGGCEGREAFYVEGVDVGDASEVFGLELFRNCCVYFVNQLRSN